jgi:hypothetical protein
MMYEQLLEALDALGWEEFYEMRSHDDHPERYPAAAPSSPRRLEAIAAAMDPGLLIRLADTPGYLVWALRLCPHVAGASCEALAREHSDSDDHAVRYWARRLLRH